MAETALHDIKDFHDVARLLEEHPEWRGLTPPRPHRRVVSPARADGAARRTHGAPDRGGAVAG